MGHYGKFGSALWATAVKISIDFSAMGNSAGFDSALQATAQGLVIRYGLWRSIWLCAMGHSEKPITIAQN
jgi:hypothetical protein